MKQMFTQLNWRSKFWGCLILQSLSLLVISHYISMRSEILVVICGCYPICYATSNSSKLREQPNSLSDIVWGAFPRLQLEWSELFWWLVRRWIWWILMGGDAGLESFRNIGQTWEELHPVNNIAMKNAHLVRWCTYSERWFSIAMLVYWRVN